MSIRRKSTTHDLATLRLHPDGSRVQQSSVNARRRTAGSTLVDARGNWIAKDAGGKSSVKKRRRISSVTADDAEREFIDLSGDEEGGEDAPSQSKGGQRAHDSLPPDEGEPQEPEWEGLNTRTRRRISFTHDLSFLDPPPTSASSLEQDADDLVASFSDPAPDLLKSIHHFASCYYRERGQLFDSCKDYRGKKKGRYKQSQENIHTLAANTREQHNTDSGTERTESDDEFVEEDEDEAMDAEDSGREGPRTKSDACRKDMYKAFDGSALMGIGIVLQEYVEHTLLSRSRTLEEDQEPERRRTG
ncbi:hypothetical protein JVU11DRAFT_1993 [Chiua virens]|nr:hypothetical protein JVU11DRAFT_1993 [Chiua virens]